MLHYSTFETWWERAGKPYEAAVIEQGGTPWVADPEQRKGIAKRLGLPIDADDMTLRRALWERGCK